MSTRRPLLPKLDAAGTTTSLACAIHCAAIPLALGFTPLSGIVLFLADPWIEWLLVSISLLIAAASLVVGFRRHRSRQILLFFLGAATILLVARLGEELAWSIPARAMSITGALALASAHIFNDAECRRRSNSSLKATTLDARFLRSDP